MTVIGEMQRAIAAAEAARGTYLLFSADSADEKAQKVFGEMAEDMERHVKILQSRQEYLLQHNPLNGAAQ